MSDSEKNSKEAIKKGSNNAAGSNSDSGDEDGNIEALQEYIKYKLKLDYKNTSTQKIIDDLSFDGLIKHWKEKGFKNIITMAGAGISTSAGIPDFRTPGTGLYDNLQKFDLPHPQAIFEINYFLSNPKPFYELAKELYPGQFKPTPCHYFVKLLDQKGLLLRHYTQNIDTLERIAGIRDAKIVDAHGTFYTSHCLGCKKEYKMEWLKEKLFNDGIPRCELCNSIVKPDIVFFGENLPEKFYKYSSMDFSKCDLIIILGTSLQVQPFAGLFENVKEDCLRLLINREKVGKRYAPEMYFLGRGLRYDEPDNTRDIAWFGNCDDGVYEMAEKLGWADELKELIKRGHEEIDRKKEEEQKIVNEIKKIEDQNKNEKQKNTKEKKNIEEKEKIEEKKKTEKKEQIEEKEKTEEKEKNGGAEEKRKR